MAVLRALVGLHPGQLFPIEGERAVLGRDPDCDIVLELGAVSRHHARVVREDATFYVEDLKSRNGTFLNGRRIYERQLLREGDELGICDIRFIFHAGPPGPAPPPSAAAIAPRSLPPAAALWVEDDRKPTGSSTIMSKVDVSSGSSSLHLHVNAEAKLRALIEIGTNLGKSLSLGEVLPKLLDSLFSIFLQADRGFVVLREPRSGRLIPQAVKYRRRDDAETIRISRTIVGEVMASKEAILSADAVSDARFEMAESIVDFQIRSMMCAPLVGSDGTALGVIQIDTLDQRSRFNRQDLDVLAAVTCQAAFVVENAQLHEAALRQQAIARELALAHAVKQSCLPRRAPLIPHYEFFSFYEPADVLGGDFYDYVPLSDGRVGVLVADVSGKGVSASLLMARLSAEARFCLASEPTPAAAVARLNSDFCDAGWEDRFVTLVLCVLDPARHGVAVVNAGHIPPLLRRRDGSVVVVAEEEARLPIGVDDGVEYEQCGVELAPGESLTLLTDGITEAMNEQDALYGYERVRGRLAEDAENVRDLGQRLLDDVKAFVGDRPQSDDMCLACFGRAADG
jgi:phosphoserine phosphatase RsbU/P